MICWTKTITATATATGTGRGIEVDVLRRMRSLPTKTQNNLALKCADGRAKKQKKIQTLKSKT